MSCSGPLRMLCPKHRRPAALRPTSTAISPYILLLILSLAALRSVEGGILNSTTYPFNIAGEVLAIAVGSYVRAAPKQSQTILPDVCEARCKATAGCSAWSYCNSTTGCVGQCRTYLKRHPPLKADSKNPTRVSLSSNLARPGPFAKLCHQDPQYLDNFAYGTCQLWQVQDPAKPFFWSNQPSDGWSSSVLQMPLGCNGLSADTCESCLASSASAGCLVCAKRVNDGNRNSVILGLTSSPRPSAACRMCYALENPATCVECLAKGKPCGGCATNSLLAMVGTDEHPGRFYNLAGCINCTMKHGEKHFRVCDDCSRQRTSQDLSKCMACVQTLKGRFCSRTEDEIKAVKPNKACIPQGQCGLCARSPMHDQCMACALLKPYRRDCVQCMALLGPTDMQACLTCAKASQPGAGLRAAPCSDCSLYANRTNVAACYNCATRQDIPGEGRNWCVSCTDWGTSPTTQDTCFKCLAKVKRPSDVAVCNKTSAAIGR